MLCDQRLRGKEAQKGEMTCPKSLSQLFFTILILQILICKMGMKVPISQGWRKD